MLYFAYGANLNLRGMKRRCPKAVPHGPAVLKGYRLEFRLYATIVPDEKSSVQGALYTLTPTCWRPLDEYEGKEYDKITVTVDTPDGAREAFAYVMKAGSLFNSGRMPPSLPYFSEIQRGYADWKFDARALRHARLATLHPEKRKRVKAAV